MYKRQALAESRSFESSWAAFTSRLAPIAEQIRYLALAPEQGGVPADWAEQRATVYVTFPIQSQGAIGPIVAALVAGILRRLERVPPPHRTLLALDEAPAVGLPRLSGYLATIRGEAGASSRASSVRCGGGTRSSRRRTPATRAATMGPMAPWLWMGKVTYTVARCSAQSAGTPPCSGASAR